MSFARSALTAFIAQVVAVGAGGATAIVVARALGPSGKGEFTLLTWLAAVIQQVTSLGLGPSNVRLLATGRARPADVILQSVLVAATMGLVLATVLGLWQHKGGIPSLKGFGLTHVLLALASVPAIQGAAYLQQILLALKRIALYNSVLIGFALLQLAALLMFWTAGRLTVGTAMWVYFGSNMVVLVLVFAALADQWLGRSPQWSLTLLNKSLRFGLVRHVADMAELASRRIGLFIVAAFAGPAASGYYSVAVTLAELVWLLPVAVAPLLFAKVASDSSEEGAKLTAQVCRVMLATSAGAVLALVVLGSGAVRFLFGSAFAPAAVMLAWMLPGVVLYVIPKTIATSLLGGGATRAPVAASLLGLAALVGAALPLGRAYGGVGVAMATSLGMAMYAVGMLVAIARSSPIPVAQYLLPRRADVPALWKLVRGLLVPAAAQGS